MRWTQQDPLNQAASLTQANRYTYVGGNPVDFVDPTGQSFVGDVVKSTVKKVKKIGRATAKGAGIGGLTGAIGGCVIASTVTAGTGCIAGAGAGGTAGTLAGAGVGAAYGTVDALNDQ